MKKLIAVSVLFTLLATAAFAQFRANLTMDFFPEVFTMTNPTGDWNSHGNAHAAYWGEGRRDFLSSNSLFNANRLYLDFIWVSPDQNADLFVRIDGRHMVNSANNSLFSTNGQGGSLNQLMWSTFEEWGVRGSVGMFTAVVGNRPIFRGKTGGAARFIDAGTGVNSAWLDNYIMSNMGIILPSYNTQASLRGSNMGGTGASGNWNLPSEAQDLLDDLEISLGRPTHGAHSGATWGGGFMETNNFVRRANWRYGQQNMPFFMLSTAIIPSLLTIDLAGDMSGFMIGGGALEENSFRRFGGGARVSTDLADLLTLDVIYRFHGNDRNTFEDENGRAEPDGLGRSTHLVGFVTRLHLIDTLGISFGYSVLIPNREDSRVGVTDTIIEHRDPILHGIDLRLNFNAIDRLAITLNNNVSFSVFRGTNDVNVHDHFINNFNVYFGSPSVIASDNGREIRQNYFAMYNLLGVRFALTDNMAVNLHLQNTLRRFNTNDNSLDAPERTVTRFQNQFIGQAVAEYGITNNVLVGGGLGFIFNHTSLDATGANSAANYGVGTFTFSVPLRIRMTF